MLAQRWKGRVLRHQIDDAMQEVFVECLKEGGALQKADRSAESGFGAYLASVVRNVALRYEARYSKERDRRVPAPPAAEELPHTRTTVSQALDRDWARAIVREAALEQERRAAELGSKALLRVELLRRRFHDNLAIRDIARQWGVDADYVHHQYAKARRDFERALLRVLRRRAPDAKPADLEAQCVQLMELLR